MLRMEFVGEFRHLESLLTALLTEARLDGLGKWNLNSDSKGRACFYFAADLTLPTHEILYNYYSNTRCCWG